ncbi:hypothetical protein WS65_28235 [Burkholderia anthina]|uniref:Uncharacterized protein n=1 Tax=Burkholderia anthina TaxID=179879 RepID=A0AAW3PSD2_9BURK|nr:hypothetical protein WS65_28235 [Burkholderia anthina]KWZ31253.1 hypothetical protein WS64_23410 [Burkholderia anthina]
MNNGKRWSSEGFVTFKPAMNTMHKDGQIMLGLIEMLQNRLQLFFLHGKPPAIQEFNDFIRCSKALANIS